MTRAMMPTSGGVTDFDVELEKVKRARAYIDQLKGAETPKGEMMGRIYVPPSWSEHLGSAVQNIAGMYGEKQLGEQESQLSKAMQAEQERWTAAQPQATPGVELPGPVEEGQGPLMSAPTQPTMQQKMQWAQQGQRNPLTRALAAKYGEDMLIKEPEREEIKAERRDKWTAELKARIEQNERTAKNDAATLEERIRANQNNELLKGLLMQQNMQIATMKDTTANKAIDARIQQNRSKMDKKMTKELDDEDAITSGIDLAIEKLTKVKDSKAGAYARGVVAELPFGGATVANMMRDEPDKDARQTTFDIAGGIQHGRYGTALSKYEKGSAAAYLPTQHDDSKELARKLTGLKELMALNHRRARLMEQGGISLEEAQRAMPYIPSQGAASQTLPVTPNTPPATSQTLPVAPGAEAPTATPLGPAFQPPPGMAPAEVERANILLSEYRRGAPPQMSPEALAASQAQDKRALRAELERLGINADTGQFDPNLKKGKGRRDTGVKPVTGVAPPTGPIRVKSFEEAMKLPSGTEFIDENGIPRTRK